MPDRTPDTATGGTRAIHDLAAAAPRESLLGTLVRVPLKLLPSGFPMPVLSGPLRGRRWIVGAATHGCWLGTYELEQQLAFVAAIRQSDTVYDIGAHTGFYTLLGSLAAGPSGRVYAFEPLPRNLGFLRRHLALNRVTNVEIFEGVVGSTSGTASFSTSGGHTQGRIAEQGDLAVESFLLDELVASERIPAPRVIKIDVEGAERAVLEGSRRIIEHHKPTLLLATHGSVARTDCLELLDRHGYSIRPLDSPVVEESNDFLAVSGGEVA